MPFLLKNISDNGDILEFNTDTPILLSYQELVNTKEKGKCNLKFKIKADKATLNGVVIQEDMTIAMTTIPKEKHTIYALTFGGWLPLPFVEDSIILADRNIIDRMKKISIGKINPELESTKWWIDKISHTNTILPVLYAYEGECRDFPSFDAFCRVFDEGAEIIQQNNLESVVYKANNYEASYQILESLKIDSEKEIEFLIGVAHLVALTHSKKKRERWFK